MSNDVDITDEEWTQFVSTWEKISHGVSEIAGMSRDDPQMTFDLITEEGIYLPYLESGWSDDYPSIEWLPIALDDILNWKSRLNEYKAERERKAQEVEQKQVEYRRRQFEELKKEFSS